MRAIAAIALSLVAIEASAASVADALRLLDGAAPLQCEVLTLRYQAMASSDPATRAALETQMHRRAAEIDAQLAPAAHQYQEALASLSEDDRARVRTYASALMKDCANSAAARFGVKHPVPSVPADETPGRKVAP